MTETVPHQAIYRRWRAQTFSQIVGQEAVVETLRNAVRTGRVSHAILFVGPRGTGKTSLARILAKAVNCTNLQDGDPCDTCPSCVAIREGRAMDLIEIDAASNRGIDAIRELRERINYAPTDLKRKVYILDEAHQITKDAWNALLKSLEEPPEFVIFMFASTHPQDFPPAIMSRLQRFDVRKLTTAEIEGKLRRILDADGRSAEPDALALIARLAAGGMRDAESILDQLLSSSADMLDEARVRDLLGLADAETIRRYIDALVASDLAAGVNLLDGLEERGRDLRGFIDQVIEVVRAALIAAATGEAAAGHAVADLIPVARRLASIDPNRAGIGGMRLQLELLLLPTEVGRIARPTTPADPGRQPAAAAPVLARVQPQADSKADQPPGPPRLGGRIPRQAAPTVQGRPPRPCRPPRHPPRLPPDLSPSRPRARPRFRARSRRGWRRLTSPRRPVPWTWALRSGRTSPSCASAGRRSSRRSVPTRPPSRSSVSAARSRSRTAS
ncbi:MAG: DNA polymerase III subunit gamma/tau [Chloroflexi bacterium]|nr:DNA polymerase III subunit gamma/tau [Chloroflexota bacterium]